MLTEHGAAYGAEPRGGGSAHAGRIGGRRDGVSGVRQTDRGRRGSGEIPDARRPGGRLDVHVVHRDREGPVYRAKGTELFSGCLDVRRDGSCKGDPAGTLRFRFKYWAQFDAQGGLVWGTCYHPITGGTGAFAGATGVIAMVDTPTPEGVSTSYIGNVTLRGSKGRAHAARGGMRPASAC